MPSETPSPAETISRGWVITFKTTEIDILYIYKFFDASKFAQGK
jgi:hypothetical protein